MLEKEEEIESKIGGGVGQGVIFFSIQKLVSETWFRKLGWDRELFSKKNEMRKIDQCKASEKNVGSNRKTN